MRSVACVSRRGGSSACGVSGAGRGSEGEGSGWPARRKGTRNFSSRPMASPAGWSGVGVGAGAAAGAGGGSWGPVRAAGAVAGSVRRDGSAIVGVCLLFPVEVVYGCNIMQGVRVQGCLCVFVCVCDGEGVCAVTFTEEAL